MQDKSKSINSDYQQQFLLEISRFNLQRGKLFAKIIIGIEFVLLIILCFNNCMAYKHTSFEYNWYAFMYLLMIIVTALVWVILSYMDRHIEDHVQMAKTLDIALTCYTTFIMLWGALVSLNDQALYACNVVFLVNVFIAAFMFYLKPVNVFISLLIGGGVFYIALPFYQPSLDILIGHNVNTSIFLIFIWFLARSNYDAFVHSFLNQKLIEEKSNLLEQANVELIKEIQSRERTQKELELANEQLMIISTLDALTGIPNRRRLDEVLKELWTTAAEKQLPISIMMIDIDFFKRYNDTHGHLAGDHCLQAVAEVLNDCRQNSSDFVARFGGEEFIFAAMGMSKNETMLLGEKIRLGVETLKIEHQNSKVSPWVTVSLGISHTLPGRIDILTRSLELADQALYRAKAEGRNRIVLADYQ